MTRTAELRDQHVDQLSGGQRQRVWIALCLAQGTDLILLDESTTYLDVANVFGVESEVVQHPVSGKPMCIPLRGRPTLRTFQHSVVWPMPGACLDESRLITVTGHDDCLSDPEIATNVVISQRTADRQVEHILAKLGFSSSAQIAAQAAGAQINDLRVTTRVRI
jgi:ABC-type cobalamin transport system ATPase subunit